MIASTSSVALKEESIFVILLEESITKMGSSGKGRRNTRILCTKKELKRLLGGGDYEGGDNM